MDLKLQVDSRERRSGIIEALGLNGFAVEEKTRWTNPPKSEDRKQRYVLEGLKGIGPKRAGALLERFGTLRNIFNASVEELEQVPGINHILAEELAQFLQNDLRAQRDPGRVHCFS